MKRTKKTKQKEPSQVDAILTADWHLREDTPTCRTDDFFQAQWKAVEQVSKLQEKWACPVLHAGDLFHHWKPSPRLLTYTMRYLPDDFHTVYGQHDLPQHNLSLAEKSGINTLLEAGRLSLLNGHWGTDPKEVDPVVINRRAILIWHHLTYTNPPYPGATGGMAAGVLRKYHLFDLILTGDNHQAFTTNYKEQLLVNPGNLTRQVASQADFRPRVYLWDAERNEAMPYYLEIEKGVVSREHIEQKEARDERITAFVERLNTDWESSLDFKKNLRTFENENEVGKPVMDICWKALEEIK